MEAHTLLLFWNPSIYLFQIIYAILSRIFSHLKILHRSWHFLFSRTLSFCALSSAQQLFLCFRNKEFVRFENAPWFHPSVHTPWGRIFSGVTTVIIFTDRFLNAGKQNHYSFSPLSTPVYWQLWSELISEALSLSGSSMVILKFCLDNSIYWL